ncbi:MAG: hypothetical protein WCG75_06205 [Armatimonadota bacterium]
MVLLSGMAFCQGNAHAGSGQRTKPVKIQRPSGSAAQAATLSNLKQTGIAIMILMSDYDDMIPYVQSTPQLFKFLMPYTKNEKVFKTINPPGGQFQFNMCLAGSMLTTLEQASQTPLFYETKVWPDGKRGVVFTDTHAKFVTKEEWDKLQPLLKLKLKKHGKPIKVGDPLPSPPVDPTPPNKKKGGRG